MTLVKVLQTDAAVAIMGFLKDAPRGTWRFSPKPHSSLLATSSPLRRSERFALAIASHRGFHLFKVDARLRGDDLCRTAILAHPIGPVMASIPDNVLTIDFLASVCAQRPDVYHLIARDIRSDPRFIRAYTGTEPTTASGESRSLLDVQVVPQEDLRQTMYGLPWEAFQSHWRAAVLRDPIVVTMVTGACPINPDDEPLLTRVFRQRPGMYVGCHDHIKRLRYVARTVFARDGLQIRNSPFTGDRDLAMIAVKQNGLALRWLRAFRGDWVIVEEAVHQNGLALAFASDALSGDGCLARIAVRQNPAAAAFLV